MKLLSKLFVVCILGCSSQDKQSTIIFPTGGYDFPKTIKSSDSNFSFYPLKNIIPRSDSFNIAYESPYFLSSFEEPNISLRPSKETIFRLTYMDTQDAFVLILTQDNIKVKRWTKGQIFPEQDENKLTELEKLHLNALRWNFPFDEIKPNQRRQLMADSMLKLYPQLISAEYYRSLLAKSELKSPNRISFSTQTISISKSKFRQLVELINSSGYWQLQYNTNCHDIPTDAGGFILEANTGIKYNVVRGTICGDKASDFIKACQEIIKVAKLDDEIHLYWN